MKRGGTRKGVRYRYKQGGEENVLESDVGWNYEKDSKVVKRIKGKWKEIIKMNEKVAVEVAKLVGRAIVIAIKKRS